MIISCYFRRRHAVLYSLQDVLVKLLPASQKLSNHLPAQSFPLQDEPGDADRRVRHETSLDQILDPLLCLPEGSNKSGYMFVSYCPVAPGPLDTVNFYIHNGVLMLYILYVFIYNIYCISVL